MKSVLISIKPKYVELIVNGEKTIEIRKSAPKEVPFKAYIYETKDATEMPWVDEDGHFIYKGRGQVIGEFICDRITDISVVVRNCNEDYNQVYHNDYGKGKPLYGWHISDLKIYDKPKELREFKRWDRTEENAPCAHTKWLYPDCKDCKACNLTRPPQSYMYVEEL